MKTSNSRAFERFIKAAFSAGLLPVLIWLFTVQSTRAGSATWDVNPVSGDWNTAANWTPATVPNGASDTATFDVSNNPGVALSSPTTIGAITFTANANAYTIACPLSAYSLTISGSGVTNLSSSEQNFTVGNGFCYISFENNASAGSNTTYTAETGNGLLEFANDSTAESSALIAQGAAAGLESPGVITFTDAASAGSADVSIEGGSVAEAIGGSVNFLSNASAAEGVFTIETGAQPGSACFFDTSKAGHSTFVVNGGTTYGGSLEFEDDSLGQAARISVLGNGTVEVSRHNAPGIAVGSIEGDGTIYLGGNNLTVGTNSRSTVFSGSIQDGGYGGGTGASLSKVGRGTLILQGTSYYSGGTTVENGKLLVTGYVTGQGPVQVNGGVFGGIGNIAGAVTISSGTTSAFLAPGRGKKLGMLTLSSTLTLNSLATYQVSLNSSTVTADEVAAKGVTINSGAQIALSDLGTGTLAAGTVFTIINNTATTPLAGTFSNLTDGSTITVGANTYLVNYEGGDGNDLTLTVQ